MGSPFKDRYFTGLWGERKTNRVRLDLPGLKLAVVMNIVVTHELIAPFPILPFIPIIGDDPKDVQSPFRFELRFDQTMGRLQ